MTKLTMVTFTWQKIESMQYNATLAVTEAIKGTSSIKLYEEIGLLRLRCWFRRLCTLLKIKTSDVLKYLFKLIPQENLSHNMCSIASMPTYCCRTSPFLLFQYPNGANLTSKLVMLKHYYIYFIVLS